MEKHGKVTERKGRRFQVRWDNGSTEWFKWTEASMSPGKGRHILGVTDGSGFDVENLSAGYERSR